MIIRLRVVLIVNYQNWKDRPPDVDWDAPPKDEYWLRVDASRSAEVQKLMDAAEGSAPAAQSGTFACSECGADVAEAENFCPSCGARFDD